VEVASHSALIRSSHHPRRKHPAELVEMRSEAEEDVQNEDEEEEREGGGSLLHHEDMRQLLNNRIPEAVGYSCVHLCNKKHTPEKYINGQSDYEVDRVRTEREHGTCDGFWDGRYEIPPDNFDTRCGDNARCVGVNDDMGPYGLCLCTQPDGDCVGRRRRQVNLGFTGPAPAPEQPGLLYKGRGGGDSKEKESEEDGAEFNEERIEEEEEKEIAEEKKEEKSTHNQARTVRLALVPAVLVSGLLYSLALF